MLSVSLQTVVASGRVWSRLVVSSFIISLTYANTADPTILQTLAEAYPDWKPRGIVDVGANVGDWTKFVQGEIFQGLDIPTFMVEASPQHETKLAAIKEEFSPHVDYKISVLSKEDNGTVEFYSRGGTGDSMFVEKTFFYKNVKPQKRDTSRLDTLVRHMAHVDYLKLDVQGAELMVLQGATETLDRVTFVQVEISVVDYNDGGVCWYQLDDFLRSHGFYFYDAAGFNRLDWFHTKGIGQFDSLYINPKSSHLPNWLRENKGKFCGADHKPEVVSEKLDGASGKYNATTPTNGRQNISPEEHPNDEYNSFIRFMERSLLLLIGFLVGRFRSRLFQNKSRVV